MKTIAITVDEDTLNLIDKLHASSDEFRSRSALIRAAIREYAVFLQRRQDEERERTILHENRERLERELKALIHAQAK